MKNKPIDPPQHFGLFEKCIQRCMVYLLYGISVYWSTGVVLKYLDEPATTNIDFAYGDTMDGIEFPIITICSRDLQTEWAYRNDLFLPILIDECGLCEYPSLVSSDIRQFA